MSAECLAEGEIGESCRKLLGSGDCRILEIIKNLNERPLVMLKILSRIEASLSEKPNSCIMGKYALTSLKETKDQIVRDLPSVPDEQVGSMSTFTD